MRSIALSYLNAIIAKRELSELCFYFISRPAKFVDAILNM